MYSTLLAYLKEKYSEIRLIKFFHRKIPDYEVDSDDLAVNGYKLFGRDSEMLDGEEVQAMLESIRSELSLGGAEKMLEVGCGCGMLGRALAGYCSEYVGIDISPQMVALAKKKVIANAQFYCMNGKKLNFPDNTFHRVFAYFVFINFPDWNYCEKVLTEMLRVVKKGQGVMLIGSLPDADSQPLPPEDPSLNQSVPNTNPFRKIFRLLAPAISIQYFNKAQFSDWGRKMGLATQIVQSSMGKYSSQRFDVIYSFSRN